MITHMRVVKDSINHSLNISKNNGLSYIDCPYNFINK